MSDPCTPGLLARLPEPPRKVVLLRASRIGDFVCATPALRALRFALPEASITMITLPMLRDLVQRSSYLDHFAAFPGFPGIAEQFFDARRAVSFFLQMQAEKFDLAIQMHESGVHSNPFMLLLGARTTAGFVRPDDPPGLLAAALPMPQQGTEIQRVLRLMTFLGAQPQGEETDYPLWTGDLSHADALLSAAEPPFIGLHPSAREQSRRWPLDRFAQAGAVLRQRHGGTALIIGEAEERAAAAYLAERIGPPCLNLAGQTSLAVLGGVISRLAVLVTNDTGPAHLAYALGTPTVTIFGTGDPARYGPPSSGPYRAVLPTPLHQPATTAIESATVAQVIAAAEDVLPQSVSLPNCS